MEPSQSDVRTFCRETWGKEWYEVEDDMKEARKRVAAAALGGAPAEEIHSVLAGDVTEARNATELAAATAARAADNKAAARAAREKAEEQAHEKDAAEAVVNQVAWEKFLGKTWEWRKTKFLNSAWRTIELQRDGTCVMREGHKRETESEETLQWEVLGNSTFLEENKGALAIVGHRGGKPFRYFSLAKFEQEYPAEADASLH